MKILFTRVKRTRFRLVDPNMPFQTRVAQEPVRKDHYHATMHVIVRPRMNFESTLRILEKELKIPGDWYTVTLSLNICPD